MISLRETPTGFRSLEGAFKIDLGLHVRDRSTTTRGEPVNSRRIGAGTGCGRQGAVGLLANTPFPTGFTPSFIKIELRSCDERGRRDPLAPDANQSVDFEVGLVRACFPGSLPIIRWGLREGPAQS